MCTLSIIPGDSGYLLAMNRDERVDRRTAFWPGEKSPKPNGATYPRVPGGGTWIAINEHRICLALLNWNDVFPPGLVLRKTRSRGLVIPDLICLPSLEQVKSALRSANLDGMYPFRLIGMSPYARQIGEWRWDTLRLCAQQHPWERRHWFSSSLSDRRAEVLRGRICQGASAAEEPASLSWLRRLHASHANGPGAFSICVHRDDAQTLSYTEVVCTGDSVHMSYFPGNPCMRWKEETKAVPSTRDAQDMPNTSLLESAYSI